MTIINNLTFHYCEFHRVLGWLKMAVSTRLLLTLALLFIYHLFNIYYLLILLTCVFSSLINVLILLCIIFLTHIYVLSVTVLTLWVATPEMFCNWYRI